MASTWPATVPLMPRRSIEIARRSQLLLVGHDPARARITIETSFNRRYTGVTLPTTQEAAHDGHQRAGPPDDHRPPVPTLHRQAGRRPIVHGPPPREHRLFTQRSGDDHRGRGRNAPP